MKKAYGVVGYVDPQSLADAEGGKAKKGKLRVTPDLKRPDIYAEVSYDAVKEIRRGSKSGDHVMAQVIVSREAAVRTAAGRAEALGRQLADPVLTKAVAAAVATVIMV